MQHQQLQRCRALYMGPLLLLLLSAATTLFLTTAEAFTPQFTTTSTSTTSSTTRLYGILDNLRAKQQELKDADADRKDTARYPDQQAATYEMSKTKVSSDDYEARLVRPLLKHTVLESRPLKTVYNAQRHGWKTSDFHQKVDKKGPAVVLAKTTNGQWIGAYNPKGWTGKGYARSSVAAFLFRQDNKSSGNKWQKLRVLGGGRLACAKDSVDTGIHMGGLVIPLLEQNNNNNSNGRQAFSDLQDNQYYESGPDNLISLLTSNDGNESIKTTTLTELKVLVGVYEAGEQIP